jgi:hypothetical protein
LVLATDVDTIVVVVEVRLPLPHDEHETLVWRVKLISWLSLAFMCIEAVVGVYAGVVAGSIALVGWGLDSMIEGVASLVIIWRFTGDRIHSETAERTAQKVVAVSFFLLAPYVAVEATATHHWDGAESELDRDRPRRIEHRLHAALRLREEADR